MPEPSGYEIKGTYYPPGEHALTVLDEDSSEFPAVVSITVLPTSAQAHNHTPMGPAAHGGQPLFKP